MYRHRLSPPRIAHQRLEAPPEQRLGSHAGIDFVSETGVHLLNESSLSLSLPLFVIVFLFEERVFSLSVILYLLLVALREKILFFLCLCLSLYRFLFLIAFSFEERSFQNETPSFRHVTFLSLSVSRVQLIWVVCFLSLSLSLSLYSHHPSSLLPSPFSSIILTSRFAVSKHTRFSKSRLPSFLSRFSSLSILIYLFLFLLIFSADLSSQRPREDEPKVPSA